jgi:hypothetical protein
MGCSQEAVNETRSIPGKHNGMVVISDVELDLLNVVHKYEFGNPGSHASRNNVLVVSMFAPAISTFELNRPGGF